MTKNNSLLLIFLKKPIFIFIFSIIVVYFLTIVSKQAYSSHFLPSQFNPVNITADDDTIESLMNEGFESTDLSQWKQTEDWEVSTEDKISGEVSLKHLAKPVSGKSTLFHSMHADCNKFDIDWSFTIKTGNWDPSASNKFWFYLSADTTISELINGWAVGVNIYGNGDLLELWRIQHGKADSMIIQSDLDWNSSTQATIHVKRSSIGKWELTYRKAGEPTSTVFTGTDLMTAHFNNIGFLFNFTYTRSGQLWIDDIKVNAVQSALAIQKLSVTNSHTISLKFNKAIDIHSINNDLFQLSDENNVQVQILQINAIDPSNQIIELQLGQVSGTNLSLTVSGVKDTSGKTIIPETKSFAYSFCPEPGIVLINEVLFNPLTGGADFVELVNVSKVPVDVHHLKLATRNDTMALRQIYSLCSVSRYLQPGGYLVCTKDSQAVAQFYLSNDCEAFCTLASFPTYPDAEGIVVLLNDSLQVMDEFNYSDNMHSPFITNMNGVSLERISLSKPTTDKSNWTSAASSAGYATPGLPNSQISANSEIIEDILTDPVVFSPNGDGYNDQMTIHYNLNKAGYVANVRIYDIAGRTIKYLVKNESLPQQGTWVWKGDSDSGQQLKLGVYIILVELFDPQGHSKTFKKVCTVSDRMN